MKRAYLFKARLVESISGTQGSFDKDELVFVFSETPSGNYIIGKGKRKVHCFADNLIKIWKIMNAMDDIIRNNNFDYEFLKTKPTRTTLLELVFKLQNTKNSVTRWSLKESIKSRLDNNDLE